MGLKRTNIEIKLNVISSDYFVRNTGVPTNYVVSKSIRKSPAVPDRRGSTVVNVCECAQTQILVLADGPSQCSQALSNFYFFVFTNFISSSSQHYGRSFYVSASI